MKASAEERRAAVQIARRLLDPNEPRLLAVGEADLLARTVLDCVEVFKAHAPVIQAAKSCIDAHGGVPRDYAAKFQDELVPAVRALHRFDAAWGGK